ncbi:MAG: sugar phosphate nucleotidyltransferase [Huintestinicola sp.]
MSASLVVLAAGIGSRFKGGIKQLTPIGASDELLIEYSVYDAIKAGFDKVIFIIRRDIDKMFRETVGNRISEHIAVEYCYQESDNIPPQLNNGRTKPWGTVHAVLSAKEHINEPFVIINADDHYGSEAFVSIYRYLTSPERTPSQLCMGGFILKNTISRFGTVTRGVCRSDCDDLLTSVTEMYRVAESDGVITGEREKSGCEPEVIPADSLVSMNMWGCSPSAVDLLQHEFDAFLEKVRREGTSEAAELALPTAFDELIRRGDISVKIFPTSDKWYGITQWEDCPAVREAFKAMAENGVYPTPLFV